MKLIIILFLFFLMDVFAQENTKTSGSQILHPVHANLVIIVGILSTMFSLTFLILACAKFCHSGASPIGHTHGLLRSRSRRSGIDKKTIESLPFFRFSSLKGSKEGLECVVCLSKFEDSEVLRLLPKCRHAFHKNCIDEWLESHSTCPLCRYKFDVADLANFSNTNSLRYPQNGSNLEEGLPNLELFVKREQDNSSRSSRFNLGSSFRNLVRSPKKEEVLIQYGHDQRVLDKYKHKIIVSDIVCKSRWSDVNSSDLISLSTEMLSVMSSKRFTPSTSRRFLNEPSIDEQVTKVKEDIERRRLHESKATKTTTKSGDSSVSMPNISSFSDNEDNEGITLSRSLDSTEKRSMSEITHVSRFKEGSNSDWGHNGKEERLRRVWLPIAKRTVRWFASRERKTETQQLDDTSPIHS